jgi:hypothetical protein
MQNNKRYWLRGGVIISIVFTLISLIGQLTWDVISMVSIPGFVILTLIDGPIFGGTIYYPTFTGISSYMLSLFISFIIYFIIGVLAGYLYGKIKNRNKNI